MLSYSDFIHPWLGHFDWRLLVHDWVFPVYIIQVCDVEGFVSYNIVWWEWFARKVYGLADSLIFGALVLFELVFKLMFSSNAARESQICEVFLPNWTRRARVYFVSWLLFEKVAGTATRHETFLVRGEGSHKTELAYLHAVLSAWKQRVLGPTRGNDWSLTLILLLFGRPLHICTRLLLSLRWDLDHFVLFLYGPHQINVRLSHKDALPWGWLACQYMLTLLLGYSCRFRLAVRKVSLSSHWDQRNPWPTSATRCLDSCPLGLDRVWVTDTLLLEQPRSLTTISQIYFERVAVVAFLSGKSHRAQNLLVCLNICAERNNSILCLNQSCSRRGRRCELRISCLI